MDRRLALHEILCKIVNMTESNGDRHVYFQPPESVKMSYPAIVYSLDDIDKEFADNSTYLQTCAYEVTVIDKDPDSEIVKKVSALPLCGYNRHFESDNLNHDVFKLYY